ncbi:MAG: hypothetical protein GWP06_06065 [Actinobacteria bacterium]|nr:hypothetical protein [Actinomycetota bacterium]
MKIQQYRKIEPKKKPQCVRKTKSLNGPVQCKFVASYIMGEEKLCKKHAQIEALELILDGSHVEKS